MQVVYARCAGLDVHQKTVSACTSVCEADGKKRRQAASANAPCVKLKGVRNSSTSMSPTLTGFLSVLSMIKPHPQPIMIMRVLYSSYK
jgi:hypothetical protein